jgi:hypothetical protein
MPAIRARVPEIRAVNRFGQDVPYRGGLAQIACFRKEARLSPGVTLKRAYRINVSRNTDEDETLIIIVVRSTEKEGEL